MKMMILKLYLIHHLLQKDMQLYSLKHMLPIYLNFQMNTVKKYLKLPKNVVVQLKMHLTMTGLMYCRIMGRQQDRLYSTSMCTLYHAIQMTASQLNTFQVITWIRNWQHKQQRKLKNICRDLTSCIVQSQAIWLFNKYI